MIGYERDDDQMRRANDGDDDGEDSRLSKDPLAGTIRIKLRRLLQLVLVPLDVGLHGDEACAHGQVQPAVDHVLECT